MFGSESLCLCAVNIKNNNQLICTYSIDKKEQQTALHYTDVDFEQLEKIYGTSFVRFICVHIAVFEGFKYTSLFPQYYDIYGFEEFITPELLDLFIVIQRKVFAQHRFENSNPDYPGPVFRYNKETIDISSRAVSLQSTNKFGEALVSCGGGKDSLLCMQLMNKSNISFSTIQYSHTIYGEANHQNKMIQTLSEACNSKHTHTLNNYETFMNEEILKDYQSIKTLCNAETPNGVFQCIPLCLQYGYKYLIVGHENSADDPNFMWKISEDRIEPVNHQWGKSLEAELLLFNYIQQYFSPDIHFFSILKPINDYLIMKSLQPYESFLSLTHSCNIAKPWCKKCPKCAYVWTCFLAYFNENVIYDIFKENPFDKEELYETFLEMMGAKGHKPFECIGEIDETRLALYYCLQKGLKGKVLNYFSGQYKDEISEQLSTLLSKYNQISSNHNLPPAISEAILGHFKQAQART